MHYSDKQVSLMKRFLVYITTADKDEARTIGRYLVQSKLAACVNIFDQMNSMYEWQGEFRDDCEAVMIAKTTEERVSSLIAAVRERHSYQCPCIVTVPIVDGNPDFLRWIDDRVRF
jgi:periplasmic divalent cation tolerance protein